VISEGRLYVRNQDILKVYDIKSPRNPLSARSVLAVGHGVAKLHALYLDTHHLTAGAK
jgi:hypothetical protein